MKVWLVITALSWNGALHVERVEVESMTVCQERGAKHVKFVNSRGSSKVMFACWRNNK